MGVTHRSDLQAHFGARAVEGKITVLFLERLRLMKTASSEHDSQLSSCDHIGSSDAASCYLPFPGRLALLVGHRRATLVGSQAGASLSAACRSMESSHRNAQLSSSQTQGARISDSAKLGGGR